MSLMLFSGVCEGLLAIITLCYLYRLYKDSVYYDMKLFYTATAISGFGFGVAFAFILIDLMFYFAGII